MYMYTVTYICMCVYVYRVVEAEVVYRGRVSVYSRCRIQRSYAEVVCSAIYMYVCIYM